MKKLLDFWTKGELLLMGFCIGIAANYLLMKTVTAKICDNSPKHKEFILCKVGF